MKITPQSWAPLSKRWFTTGQEPLRRTMTIASRLNQGRRGCSARSKDGESKDRRRRNVTSGDGAQKLRHAAVCVFVASLANSCSGFLVSPIVRWAHEHASATANNHAAARSLVRMEAIGGSDRGSFSTSLRGGLAKQEFKSMLDEKNTLGCIKVVQEHGRDLNLDMADASKMLTLASEGLFGSHPDENKIKDAYLALKDAGLLRAFGSIDLGMVPVKSRSMSRDKLEQMTGMKGQNLSPGRPTGLWLGAGVGLFAAEMLAGQLLNVDALQTIIPLTLGTILTDRIVLGGAVAESITRAVVPGYRERIVRHEAGHFLVAYLLGCPVQGCLLDPFVVGRNSGAGTQGGMVFTDPVFTKGMENGKLTRWAIDRFTTVLMGGIAAEAIHYGSCEGGAADEGFMIQILSTISPPFVGEQIKSQAFWAATQAVLLLREHKGAYDKLVTALDRGAELGECVEMIEEELAKRPLPGDVNADYKKPTSPAEEVRGMLVRRMSHRYSQQQRGATTAPGAGVTMAGGVGEIDGRSGLEDQMAEKDKAMLDLQRRVRELERAVAEGGSLEGQGLREEDGGVWLNDLKALKEDISAASEKDAFLDAVMSDKEGIQTQPNTATLATTSEPSANFTEATRGAASSAAGTRGERPGGSSPAAEKLKDIETKTAENSKRMAEVEARLRAFEEKQTI